MNEDAVLALFMKIMREAPEVIDGLGRVATHLLSGEAGKEEALREARLVAETIGIKQAAEAPYRK